MLLRIINKHSMTKRNLGTQTAFIEGNEARLKCGQALPAALKRTMLILSETTRAVFERGNEISNTASAAPSLEWVAARARSSNECGRG